jgi:hypothetical protein
MIQSYIKKVSNKDDRSINRLALVFALITTAAIVTIWLVLSSLFSPEEEVREENTEQRTLQEDVQLLIQETQVQIERLNSQPTPTLEQPQGLISDELQGSNNQQGENSIELSEQESTELMYTQ